MQAAAVDCYPGSYLGSVLPSSGGLLSHCGMFNVCRPFLSTCYNAQYYGQPLGHCRCQYYQQCQGASASCPVAGPLPPTQLVRPLGVHSSVGGAASPPAELQVLCSGFGGGYSSLALSPAPEVFRESPAQNSTWYAADASLADVSREPCSPGAEFKGRATPVCVGRQYPENRSPSVTPLKGECTPDYCYCAVATEVEVTTPAYRLQVSNRQPRKDRLSFTMEQLRELEKSFTTKKYLCASERQELALKIGVREAQVKTWYQNRRTKWKRNYKFSRGHVVAINGCQ